jgi:hypothetical protein
MHEIYTSGKRETRAADARSKKTYKNPIHGLRGGRGQKASHLSPSPAFLEKIEIKKNRKYTMCFI